jgi:PilZ domain
MVLALIGSTIQTNGSKPMALAVRNRPLERRRHPRFNVDLPVKYRSSNLFFKHARAVNVSEGGLLVHLPEEIEINQTLALQLFFPSRSHLYNLETVVKVVWKDIHMSKDLAWDYRTGVRFVDTAPEDISELKSFLMSFGQKPVHTA